MTALLILFVALVVGEPDLDRPVPGPRDKGDCQEQKAAIDSRYSNVERDAADETRTGAEPVIAVVPVPPASHREPNKHTTEDNEKPVYDLLLDVASVLLTFALVVIAGIQAWGLYHQVETNRRLVVASERPWLAVSVASDPEAVADLEEIMAADTAPSTDELLMLTVKVQNTGRGMAWVKTEWTDVSYRVLGEESYEVATPDSREPLRLTAMPLAPDESRLLVAPVVVTPDQQAEMMDGGGELLFQGVVGYRDGFGQEHETRFAFTYQRPCPDLPGFRGEGDDLYQEATGWDAGIWISNPGPTEFFRYT